MEDAPQSPQADADINNSAVEASSVGMDASTADITLEVAQEQSHVGMQPLDIQSPSIEVPVDGHHHHKTSLPLLTLSAIGVVFGKYIFLLSMAFSSLSFIQLHFPLHC